MLTSLHEKILDASKVKKNGAIVNLVIQHLIYCIKNIVKMKNNNDP